MIIGECPSCNGLNMTPCADVCPVFSRETCEECGGQYWLKHSRWDPKAYPLEAVKVDEATRKIISVDEGYGSGDSGSG